MTGLNEPEWEHIRHLMERDGYHESIRSFWFKTGLNATKAFYEETDDRHRYTIYCKPFGRAQDQDPKRQKTREGHHESKRDTVTHTAVRDSMMMKKKKGKTTCHTWNGVIWKWVTVDNSNRLVRFSRWMVHGRNTFSLGFW